MPRVASVSRGSQCELCTLRSVMITLTDFRRRLGRLLAEARLSGEAITITNYGEHIATVIPAIPPPREPGPQD
jgi:prevent-host-death family protein